MRKILLTVLVTFLIPVLNGQLTCPACNDNFSCVTSLKQSDCGIGQILVQKAGLCNCCPGCKGGQGLGASGCNIAPCAPGLICDDKKFFCTLDKRECNHLMYIKDKFNWVPTCETDGTYSAKQCKGDRASGRCFCYDLAGNRMFGWDWWRNADNMTCTCSRLRHKIEATGKISTLHCTQNGNFEELQCDDGVCWCAEPKTGRVQEGTIAVPSALWNMLPCYNETAMGATYLRQCESASFAQRETRRIFAIHGTTQLTVREIICDYDGSYGYYSITSGIANCLWRDGKTIGGFQAAANQLSSMNCNCARDSKIYSESNIEFSLTCNGNGNYETLQSQNLEAFCVDSDGFAVTDKLPINPSPTCADYLYSEYEYEPLPTTNPI